MSRSSTTPSAIDWGTVSGSRPTLETVEQEIQARELGRNDRVAAVLSFIGRAVIAAIGTGLVLFFLFALVCFAAVASDVVLPELRTKWLSDAKLDVARTVVYTTVTMTIAPLVAPILGFRRPE